jgi:hypothetical protein
MVKAAPDAIVAGPGLPLRALQTLTGVPYACEKKG